MTATLELVATDEEFFSAAFAAFGQLEIRSEQALLDLGEDVARRERAAGPRGVGEHGIDTIEVTSGRSLGLFWIDVGPGREAFYLGFYEFGTQHQPPRPFMRPSVAIAISAWRP